MDNSVISPSLKKKKRFYLFIYFWLYWVFIAARAFLQLWGAGPTLQLQCSGFSLWQLLLLASMGLWGTQSSAVAAQGLQQLWFPGSQTVAKQLSTTCEIFPDQGSNPCLLHSQADSFTIEPPGKPSPQLFISAFLLSFLLLKNKPLQIPGFAHEAHHPLV